MNLIVPASVKRVTTRLHAVAEVSREPRLSLRLPRT